MIKKDFTAKIVLILMVLAFTALPAELCFSMPQDPEIVSGEVTITSPDASTMNISASDKSIINFNSFNIAENESVMITLPDVNSEILNRVLGSDPSNILGTLSCNGVVFLINPNGVYIGAGANIDVGSIVISTRDITDSNFLSSNYVFEKLSKDQLDSLILNQGLINIREGGFGVLIAGAVENQGTIIAHLGTIAMASGDLVTLSFSQNGLISIAIDEETAQTVLDRDGNPITDQLKNSGTIQADGGVVLFNADSVNGLFEKAVNLEGHVRADKVGDEEGTIRILASGDVSINGELSADLIEISDPAGLIATNVNITKDGTLKATSGISIYALENITNEGAIQATGDITLKALTGAVRDLTITPLTADTLTVMAPEILINSAASHTSIYKTGVDDMYIATSTPIGDIVRITGNDLDITYLYASDITLRCDNTVHAAEAVILSGSNVSVMANKFGSVSTPLSLSLIHI